ncbi:ArsR/SmtB family transcription factor [Paraglaciecola hydrolytica]|uniref:ArsR family transcriptional regulator n=1 Tax=Paraglaciecola hydrolytica TaxID=1799789 RepID=A0A148KNH0_9ALTE|nr:metalloregulator ArsR/SmtB family transcription factor [Paraglaciecola hydrolytica]KXI27830.1 ArsR family transcriptional regulator [Paraglaciecola hydrolytica]
MELEQLASNAEQAEAFMKILANKNRLMILCSLLDKECSVSELNQCVPLGQSALSQHLAVLREHKLVGTRREAQSIMYSVSDPRVKQIIEKLYEFFCAV